MIWRIESNQEDINFKLPEGCTIEYAIGVAEGIAAARGLRRYSLIDHYGVPCLEGTTVSVSLELEK